VLPVTPRGSVSLLRSLRGRHGSILPRPNGLVN
jgi:hypothetical protein